MTASVAVNEIGSREASDLLAREPRALFIDVRSHMEYLFVGHPRGAIHIPWIDEPEWTINPHFLRDVRQLVLGGAVRGEDVPVVLICRSGKRSREAGELLVQNGFQRVYNIRDGFEGPLDDEHHRSTQGGWRFEGLPWEQC
jgi:rhodanese-related sulfurtransferase